jgi:hypothetical protein
MISILIWITVLMLVNVVLSFISAYSLSRIDIGVHALVRAKHSESVHTPMKLEEIIQHLKAIRKGGE